MEIFSSPQVLKNSRQYWFLRTDVLQGDSRWVALKKFSPLIVLIVVIPRE